MAASTKLARRVADQVIDDVIADGWPEGSVLGAEPELLKRYGVSRAVFREAVRLLEHRGVVTTKRGPGGGVMVAAPGIDSVLDAVSIYVHAAEIGLEELFEVRRIVEAHATALATARLDEDDVRDLRQLRDGHQAEGSDHQELHRHIAVLSGNPAIELFCTVLTRLTRLYYGSLRSTGRDARLAAEHTAEAHRQIVDAMISGNAGLASHEMLNHLDEIERYLVSQGASLSVLDAVLNRGGSANGAQATTIARRIMTEVATEGWQPGAVFGSEAELLDRLGVSRSVLREAVRLLEHHQVAEMRQGPGGGLVVTEPGPEAIAEAMSIILEHRRAERDHLFDARIALEIAAADLAATKQAATKHAATKQATQPPDRLLACLDDEARDPLAALDPSGQHVHLAAAEMTENRLLVLFLRMLIRMSVRRSSGEIPPGLDVEALASRVHDDHRKIVEAIAAGDGPIAMLRMRRHFVELAPTFNR